MVKDSKVQDGKYPGQAIRYPVEENERFEPLEKQSYLEKIFYAEPLEALDHGVE